jgi:hypothetical protein
MDINSCIHRHEGSVDCQGKKLILSYSVDEQVTTQFWHCQNAVHEGLIVYKSFAWSERAWKKGVLRLSALGGAVS